MRKIIERETLLGKLQELESARTFSGITALYEEVGTSLGVSISKISQLVREYQLAEFIKTKKNTIPVHQRKPNLDQEEQEIVGVNKTHEKALKSFFPKFLKTIKKILGGSRQEAIKLHCLDCVGMEKSEITNCELYSCPFWSFRPYQRGEEDVS